MNPETLVFNKADRVSQVRFAIEQVALTFSRFPDCAGGIEDTYFHAFQGALPVITKPALTFKKLYLAVSRSNKNAQTIINDFNQAIAEMQQDGSYDQIVSHYKY
jgi:hypothetical protein